MTAIKARATCAGMENIVMSMLRFASSIKSTTRSTEAGTRKEDIRGTPVAVNPLPPLRNQPSHSLGSRDRAEEQNHDRFRSIQMAVPGRDRKISLHECVLVAVIIRRKTLRYVFPCYRPFRLDFTCRISARARPGLAATPVMRPRRRSIGLTIGPAGTGGPCRPAGVLPTTERR